MPIIEQTGRFILYQHPDGYELIDKGHASYPGDDSHRFYIGNRAGLFKRALEIPLRMSESTDQRLARLWVSLSPPSIPAGKLTHKKLNNLGLEYADYVVPEILKQARESKYPLPCRSHTELFPVLKDVYVLLEQQYGIPWDSLTAAKQTDFLVGFWSRLKVRGILERSPTGR